jgi:hypothetical protein
MKLLGVWELRSPQVYVYIGELPGFVEGWQSKGESRKVSANECWVKISFEESFVLLSFQC